MAWISTILLSFVFLLICESFCDFPSDYLGNYLSDDEYNNRKFCWTKICMEDSGRLIYAADHDSNKTAACDDFKTFAMGEFFEHRVLNDRYQIIGFLADVTLQHAEKVKNILLKPMKESDSKMFKVMRRYYLQCINFTYVENQGLHDVIELGQSLGIVPASFEDDTQRLDLQKAMFLYVELFFERNIAFCENGTVEMLCLRKVWYLGTNLDINGFTELVSENPKIAKLNKNYKNRIEEDFKLYMMSRKSFQDSLEGDSNQTLILEIKEMYEKYPSKHLDWLQMINSHLLSDSQVTLHDKILIRDPKSFEGLYQLFAELEETSYQARRSHTKRALQRHEQCLNTILSIMPSALESLTAVHLYDQSVQDSATEFVELALADVMDEISKNEKIPNAARDLITNKLKSVKLLVMFPDDILNLPKMDGLYDELDFNGNEFLPELFLKISLHVEKLQNKHRDHWYKRLDTIVSEGAIRYFANTNLLYVPVMYTLYPFFHPNRSRFFNMATLYSDVALSVTEGLIDAFSSSDSSLNNTDYDGITYKSYVRWEENGGVELQLPSFKLTNRQMFWLCAQHVLSVKSHKNFKIKRPVNIRPGFREAYKCGDIFENKN